MIPETKITELAKPEEVSTSISDTIKGIFSEYIECDRISVSYYSPSTGDSHTQIFFREDTTSLLQSCFNISDDPKNPIPLADLLKDYGKIIISLFTADSIKAVINQFQAISHEITDLFGNRKK
jgi:hypothetical protein